MLSNPQLVLDGLTLQVRCSLNHVEVKFSIGKTDFEKPATGLADFSIFLKPEEVDNLIERLKISKDALRLAFK